MTRTPEDDEVEAAGSVADVLTVTMAVDEAYALESAAERLPRLHSALSHASWDWGDEDSPIVSATGDPADIARIRSMLQLFRTVRERIKERGSAVSREPFRSDANAMIERWVMGAFASRPVVWHHTSHQPPGSQNVSNVIPTRSSVPDNPAEIHNSSLPADDASSDDEDGFERPDDAIDCPFCDRPFARGVCEACGGRRWLTLDEVDEQLGGNRVPCLRCGGEGEADYFGPASWSCPSCFGTGEMPVSELSELDLAQYPIEEQDWSGADLTGMSLSGATFTVCDLSEVNFEGADLTGASFLGCDFTGANPELAASLDGTHLRVSGLTSQQIAICAAKSAVVEESGAEASP
jgi:Pentapeptide repeats (8 copies)